MGMTSVRIPDELMSKLENTAAKRRRSKSWLINDAVREYLEKEEQQEQRLLETQEALNDMQAGRLVDGKDVMDWLASWGSDDELQSPKK